MKNYTVYKSSGEIVVSGTCEDDAFSHQIAVCLDGTLVELSTNPNSQYMEDGQPVEKPAIPSPDHEFDWDTKQWVDPRTMEDLRTACRNRINVARLNANQSGFMHEGKLFATDPLSRSDIDGINGYVTLWGSLPETWAGAWKAEDNTYLPISNLDEWKAFYASMVAAGNMNFAISEQLKAALALADTPVEIEVIVWPT